MSTCAQLRWRCSAAGPAWAHVSQQQPTSWHKRPCRQMLPHARRRQPRPCMNPHAPWRGGRGRACGCAAGLPMGTVCHNSTRAPPRHATPWMFTDCKHSTCVWHSNHPPTQPALPWGGRCLTAGRQEVRARQGDCRDGGAGQGLWPAVPGAVWRNQRPALRWGQCAAAPAAAICA